MNRICLIFVLYTLQSHAQVMPADSAEYKQLGKQLDTILIEDQKYRLQLDSIANTFGGDSREIREAWRHINSADSLNLFKVKWILNKYGWLGPKEVGDKGHAAIFLIIQHADLETQKQYFPLLKTAVANKNGTASYLALLQDRIDVTEGRLQTYGSQTRCHGDKCWLLPLEDPDNVDARRKEVGLEPLADYLLKMNMKWDLNEYKKEHPEPVKKKKKMLKSK